MKKYLFIVTCLVLILLSSCATKSVEVKKNRAFLSSAPDSEQYEALFDAYNKYNGRVALGISGPYVNKRNAVEAATLNCLQTLSFYRGLAVETDMSTVVNTSRRKESFDSLSIGGTADSIFQKTSEDMEIVEIIWFGGDIGVAVFATLPEMKEINWNGNLDEPESHDELIYIAGDTSAGRYSKYSNAIEAAVFRAAVKLTHLDEHSINVNNTIINTTQSSYSNQNFSISGSRLEGFTVVALRYDEESGRVYALAAAKRSGL